MSALRAERRRTARLLAKQIARTHPTVTRRRRPHYGRIALLVVGILAVGVLASLNRLAR